MKILMVCLGNICRSPIAEGVMRDTALQNGLSMVVDSAGTQGYHAGEAPDPRAIACMARHGLDIAGLRARKFQSGDFQEFDVIFTMDQNNYQAVLQLARSSGDRAKVIPFLSILSKHAIDDVPDPYYGSTKDFEYVLELCTQAAQAWCLHWQAKDK